MSRRVWKFKGTLNRKSNFEIYDVSKSVELHTDVSENSIEAVLP